MPLDLSEKQKKGMTILCDSSKSNILFSGGSRSGKTALIMEFLIQRAFEFPESRQLIARKHKNACKASIWKDTLRKYLKTFIPTAYFNKRESELIIEFSNGSEIHLGGLEDDDSVDRVLGTEYITIFLNEATQLTYGVVNTVSSRLAQYVKNSNGVVAKPKLILDCNPQSRFHWLYDVGVKHRDPETKIKLKNYNTWGYLHFTPYDNIEHLPEGYIDTLDALPPLARSRMLEGKWVSAEGLIFPEFNEKAHVVPRFEIPTFWNKYASLDFGVVHPTAWLAGAVAPNGDLYIYKEYCYAGARIQEHAKMIKTIQNNDFIIKTWSDHDKNARMEYHANGIYTTLAIKDFKKSVDEVSKRLHSDKDNKPTIYIMDNCIQLIQELFGYCWKVTKSNGISKEEQVKLNDDLMDCLRYICTGLSTCSNLPKMF